MTKAMIVSLGGTAAPVVKSIAEHAPEFVCFYCSESSIENVGEVKAELARQGCRFANRNVMVEDAEDLVACYRAAIEASDRIEGSGVGPGDVVVDYTGGTKTMSAALALATVGKGYRFSYVGGAERDKEGLGAVVDGTERVRTGLSPWRLFAVEEKRMFAGLFNRHLFVAAAEVLEGALRHEPLERRLLAGLKMLTLGYSQWDAFRHAEAKKMLRAGLDDLEVWLDSRDDPRLSEAVHAARLNLEFLNRMQRETHGFKRRNRLHVCDLLANARRRSDVQRHDDAVARVYRALELMGQLAFSERFGCETGAADPERLPPAIREEYRRRYGDPADGGGGKLRVPLFACFRALSEADDEVGLAFMASREEFDKLLFARNDSILAHGFTPIKPGLAERFERVVRETFGVEDRVEFPRFGF